MAGSGELEVLGAAQWASPCSGGFGRRMPMRFRLEAEPELRDQAAKRALGQTVGAGGEKLLPLGQRLKEDIQRLLLAGRERALGGQVRDERDERIGEGAYLQLER